MGRTAHEIVCMKNEIMQLIEQSHLRTERYSIPCIQSRLEPEDVRSQIFIAAAQLDEQRLAQHSSRDAFWQGFYNYLAKDQTDDAEEMSCLSEVLL